MLTMVILSMQVRLVVILGFNVLIWDLDLSNFILVRVRISLTDSHVHRVVLAKDVYKS
jgi:hypothetical protein